MTTQKADSSRAGLDFWVQKEEPAKKEDPAKTARDRLLQKISQETDLPALGSSVSRVVQMTSSDDEAVRNLAHFILSDVALTQKILRIANTVFYRTASSTPVTTVSKAIFLLGFDTVKTNALAMLLVDKMSTRHAQSVRTELNHALCASIVGREMARRAQYKDAWLPPMTIRCTPRSQVWWRRAAIRLPRHRPRCWAAVSMPSRMRC